MQKIDGGGHKLYSNPNLSKYEFLSHLKDYSTKELRTWLQKADPNGDYNGGPEDLVKKPELVTIIARVLEELKDDEKIVTAVERAFLSDPFTKEQYENLDTTTEKWYGVPFAGLVGQVEPGSQGLKDLVIDMIEEAGIVGLTDDDWMDIMNAVQERDLKQLDPRRMRKVINIRVNESEKINHGHLL